MLRQASVYVGVQIAAYLVDLGTFSLLQGVLGVSPLLANALGKCLAAVLAFMLHRWVTFAEARDAPLKGQALRYLAVLALHIPLASLLLLWLLEWTTLPIVAKVLSDIGSVAITYLLSRHLVFVAAPQQNKT